MTAFTGEPTHPEFVNAYPSQNVQHVTPFTAQTAKKVRASYKSLTAILNDDKAPDGLELIDHSELLKTPTGLNILTRYPA